MSNALAFTVTDIPTETDTPPVLSMPEGTTAFDPEFEGSTEDAPYGYKADGTPYKRRPNAGAGRPKGSGGKSSGKVNESSARAAASMLAQVNNLVGMSLTVFGLPMTAAAMVDANAMFETMAMEALKTDPKLCRKILSAGAVSGRTALIVAYGYMGMAILPAARVEYAAKREEVEDADVYAS